MSKRNTFIQSMHVHMKKTVAPTPGNPRVGWGKAVLVGRVEWRMDILAGGLLNLYFLGAPQNRRVLPVRSRAELWLVVSGSNLFLSVHSYVRRLREYLA